MIEDDNLAGWVIAALAFALGGMTMLAAYSFTECASAQERLKRICVAGTNAPTDGAFRAAWDSTCK